MKIIELIVQGVPIFITEMLNLPKINIIKLLAKPTKEKEREKEAAIYRKITSLETLVYQKGWKVFLLKGMHATKLSTLIQVIWLEISWLTYITKKLMNIIILAE